MREFIEKLAKKTQHSGEYKCDKCIISDLLNWKIYGTTKDGLLEITRINSSGEILNSVLLIIFEDEYNCLQKVFKEKEEEARLTIIEFLNNL